MKALHKSLCVTFINGIFTSGVAIPLLIRGDYALAFGVGVISATYLIGRHYARNELIEEARRMQAISEKLAPDLFDDDK